MLKVSTSKHHKQELQGFSQNASKALHGRLHTMQGNERVFPNDNTASCNGDLD